MARSRRRWFAWPCRRFPPSQTESCDFTFSVLSLENPLAVDAPDSLLINAATVIFAGDDLNRSDNFDLCGIDQDGSRVRCGLEFFEAGAF
ncbi:MAG: hypothetical protein QNJ40_16470 [Xanthomonadales bacterium]|nr:hypothetical protein [Xanthomonadales bacterium]